jgi:UDP-glucose 4-epimerase
MKSQKKNMKVLITGSSGSLGSMITTSLTAEKIQVIGIDIKDPPENKPGEYFSFYNCSITDKDSLKSIFSKEGPTHVIHLACTFNKVRNRQKEYEIDIGGSKNIIEISDKIPSVKQLIFSSSAAAYGGNKDNPSWINEIYPLRPGKYRYGINKKLIEGMYSEIPVREDLHINIVRICTVIGPSFSKPASVVSLLLKFPWLPGFCKENKVQFLHEEDFVTLIHLIIPDDQIKGVFNIAPDSYSAVKELLPDKKFIKIPVLAITGILSVLWNLRIMNLQPESINASIYPIVLDPGKISSRYNYKFKYTSSEAFNATRINNKLPSNVKF